MISYPYISKLKPRFDNPTNLFPNLIQYSESDLDRRRKFYRRKTRLDILDFPQRNTFEFLDSDFFLSFLNGSYYGYSNNYFFNSDFIRLYHYLVR
jgi:hypothetical protein